MSASCTFTVIGASEETVAHIRLLLRIAGPRLEHSWEQTEGDNADLIIIGPHGDLATSAIQTRCEATGIPYAILADPEATVVHGMVLRRPLKLDQVLAVFNAAGHRQAMPGIMPGLGADFYTTNLDVPGAGSDTTITPPAVGTLVNGIDAFDLLVHGDPVVEPVPSPPLIQADTELEQREGGTSARSNLQRDAGTRVAASLVGVASQNGHIIDLEPLPDHVHAKHGTTNKARSEGAVLPDLLREGQLLSPQRIHAQGLPDLVLDPKAQCYYSASPLQELMPYATADATTVHHEGIAGRDLQHVRESRIPRKFDELRWLFALANSHGRLDGSLDPGGSYAIVRPFAAAPELRHHARIATAMATPTPLHEAARASEARMEDVFDIVNAYVSVERIQYVPRQSLRQQEATEKRGLWGLFSRK